MMTLKFTAAAALTLALGIGAFSLSAGAAEAPPPDQVECGMSAPDVELPTRMYVDTFPNEDAAMEFLGQYAAINFTMFLIASYPIECAYCAFPGSCYPWIGIDVPGDEGPSAEWLLNDDGTVDIFMLFPEGSLFNRWCRSCP